MSNRIMFIGIFVWIMKEIFIFIMSEKFKKEFIECTKNEGYIDLPKEILDRRMEFLSVVDELINHKLTVAEANKLFIILAGLLLGKYPKIAAVVKKSDRIRLPYAVIDQLPATKGRLTSHEKLFFAFCTFHAVCIEVYDKKADKIRKGIYDIDSPSHVIQLLNWEMKSHPERFEFLSTEKRSVSVSEGIDFGVSLDNPVKAVSIADGYNYLNQLRTSEGNPVKYERLGSMSGKNGNIIDGYMLYYEEAGAKHNIKIYIDPYAVENSGEAPRGLKIVDSEKRSSISSVNVNAENPSALFNLGTAYYNGDGVPKNRRKAINLWCEAAQQGNVNAQFNLGLLFHYGTDVEQNYKEAFEWYYKAAQQGHAKAQCNLGLLYSKGLGVPENKQAAIKWYSLAAEQGLPEAQHDLGFHYYVGDGVEPDTDKAISLWLKAAKQGYADSQNNLGYLYRTIRHDYLEALKWYRLAADQNNAEAQYDLGFMYENGQGVKRDRMKAIQFYRMAADNGNEEALEALERIAK